MHDITDKILSYIDDKNIHSLPRWWFILKNFLYWFLFVLFVLLGAKTFGLLLLELVDADVPFLFEIHDNTISWIQVLPILWILLMIGFAAISLYFFKHTKEGYQYRVGRILLLNVSLSLAIGSLSFAVGFSEFTDEYINDVFPTYNNIREQRQELWTHPEQGRISGRVINVFENRTFLLEDFGNFPWTVNIDAAIRRPGARIEPGFELRIVGEKIKDGEFSAHMIAPMAPNNRPPVGNHLRILKLPPAFPKP